MSQVAAGEREANDTDPGRTSPRDVRIEERTLQQRLEESRVGRVLISVVLLFILLALLATNLPESELKETMEPAFAPVLDGAALSQRWSLFAPNPRRISRELEARLIYADGTQAVWTRPDGDRVIGGYRDYRWEKWGRDITLSQWRENWASVARWVAEDNRRDGELPVQVTLVRRFSYALPPGTGAEEPPPWEEHEVFRVRYGVDHA